MHCVRIRWTCIAYVSCAATGLAYQNKEFVQALNYFICIHYVDIYCKTKYFLKDNLMCQTVCVFAAKNTVWSLLHTFHDHCRNDGRTKLILSHILGQIIIINQFFLTLFTKWRIIPCIRQYFKASWVSVSSSLLHSSQKVPKKDNHGLEYSLCKVWNGWILRKTGFNLCLTLLTETT